MTTQEYLEAVLKSQDLSEDSSEWKTLIARRKEVEKVLRDGFPDSSPTIRYGGSKAKGTLIREAYDLDIVCYFPNDDTSAGDSLKDIYNNAAAILGKEYSILRKTSALRIRDRQSVDFHIDVVPGRFTDETKGDCFLYQESGDKCRLKTNLDVHITHVRESGVLDAIRLLKLWKTRKVLQVRQFAFDLLIIKLLGDQKKKSLADQLIHVWTKFRDLPEPISVEDPANPSGNDLTSLLAAVWDVFSRAARSTIDAVDQTGWETVFGKIASEDDKTSRLKVAAAAVVRPTRPWCA